MLRNPDKGFSGSGLETIAGLKVALGLERVDLVGGNGRDDVNEGIDDGSMLGQIEGRELLDMADVGHVPGIQQGGIIKAMGSQPAFNSVGASSRLKRSAIPGQFTC